MPGFERMPSFDRTPSATARTVERLYNEGVQMKLLGDKDSLEEAERCFREAVRRKPDYIPALMGLGGLLKETGNHAEGNVFINQATLSIVNPPVLPGEKIRRSHSVSAQKESRMPSVVG
mmetsp:Transcript_14620/g.23215  ORF Transcript_14620/g.23215 Transcript_14620/m.23215 type:complete len:119 (-) Transcript_14620:152-508(-)